MSCKVEGKRDRGWQREGGGGLSRLASPVCAWSRSPPSVLPICIYQGSEENPSRSTEPPFYPLNLHRDIYTAQWVRTVPDEGSAGQFRERLFSLPRPVKTPPELFLFYFYFWGDCCVLFCFFLLLVCYCPQPHLNSRCSSVTFSPTHAAVLPCRPRGRRTHIHHS